jgi:hypothetical protein
VASCIYVVKLVKSGTCTDENLGHTMKKVWHGAGSFHFVANAVLEQWRPEVVEKTQTDVLPLVTIGKGGATASKLRRAIHFFLSE